MDDLPTYAVFLQRRMKVLGYYRNGYFFVLDPKGDERRMVHRDRLIFLPERATVESCPTDA